jgi:hypothetical protein
MILWTERRRLGGWPGGVLAAEVLRKSTDCLRANGGIDFSPEAVTIDRNTGFEITVLGHRLAQS